jgi:hypothetical protein
MTDSTLITAEQVATINEARTVLTAIARNAHMQHESQASGMIFARAEAAEADLFQLLNWFHSYAHGDLSHAQLHNEAEGVWRPASPLDYSRPSPSAGAAEVQAGADATTERPRS